MPSGSSQFPLLAEVEPARPAQNGRPEVSPVYRPAFHKDSFPKLDGIETCYDLFEKSCQLYPDCPCLGERAPPGSTPAPAGSTPSSPSPSSSSSPGPYVFMTYREVAEAVEAVAGGYVAAGLGPGDRIGVLGANCKEWMMAMQGMNRMSMVCVPLYETLGDSAVEFIIKHSGTRLVVCSAAKLPVVARALRGEAVRQV
ncbi:hypothetical protein Agub_g1672, partial [Astrephomene gubernaculifera]